MTTHTQLIERRKKNKVTQSDMADIIGVSRPTYVKIENGARALSAVEQQKIDCFFNAQISEHNIRIDIPQQNIEKFKQVLLYITQQIGARSNVGMTVLYKLLYFIDFDYYEKYETQLMGLTYFKNTHGPAPREFKKVMDQMINNNEIEQIRSKHYKYEQKKFIPLCEPDLTCLNAQELSMIDDVIERYGYKTATTLSHLSHIDTPWAIAQEGKDLAYEHVFYRPDQFSVREYEEL